MKNKLQVLANLRPLTRAELYQLLESLPESNKSLAAELRAALNELESPLPVYGKNTRLKP